MNIDLFEAFSRRPDRLFFARIAAERFLPNADVLDLGCGDGKGAVFFGERGYRVTAVDRTAHVFEGMKAACPQVDFVCGDAAQLPFAREQFDGIFCEASFSSFEFKEAAAAELYRVLKPSGVLVVCDYVLEKEADDLPKPPAISGALTDTEYHSLFCESGFEICEEIDQRAFLVSIVLHLCKVLEKGFGELMEYLGTAQGKYGFKMYVMKKQEGFYEY